MGMIVLKSLSDALWFGLGAWLLMSIFRNSWVPRTNDEESDATWRARQTRSVRVQAVFMGVGVGAIGLLDDTSALFLPRWTDHPAAAVGLKALYFGVVVAILASASMLFVGHRPADVTNAEWRARVYRFGAWAFAIGAALPIALWLIRVVL